MNPQLKHRLKIGVVVVAVILLLIIFFQNRQQVTVSILFTSGSMPLMAWLILVLLSGMLLGYVASSILRRRKLAGKEKKIS